MRAGGGCCPFALKNSWFDWVVINVVTLIRVLLQRLHMRSATNFIVSIPSSTFLDAEQSSSPRPRQRQNLLNLIGNEVQHLSEKPETG